MGSAQGRRRDSGDSALTTRDQLLRAVIDIAGEQGQQFVTYRSVAARANVAHGLVRHYFGTRQALLAEALEQAVGEEISDVTLSTDRPDAFAEGLIGIAEDAWTRRVLQFDVVLNAIRGIGDVQLAYRLYDRYLSEISQTLESLGIEDPDGSWAAFFFAALDGLVLQQALFRADDRRTRAALDRVREVLAGLSERSAAAGEGQ